MRAAPQPFVNNYRRPAGFSRDSRSHGGFTLIELLIAMALFSFLLLIISAGFITITKIYRSTLSGRTTQENARTAMEAVTRAARYGETAEVVAGRLCIKGGLQTVRFRRLSDSNTIRLAVQNLSDDDCGGDGNAADTNYLTDSDVQVTGFNPRLHAPEGGRPSVVFEITVATNTPDLFNSSMTECNPAAAGAQFCSTSKFSSAVSLRGQ